MRSVASLQPDRARKPVKTLFGWLLFRRISLPLSLLVARTPVRPSHLTATGLAVGLGGAAALATGSYRWQVTGAVLALVAKVLDAMDGEVARVTGRDTPAGYVADGLVDRLRDTALLVGVGVGLARAGHPDALAWTLVALWGWLAFFYVSAVSPAHWREARSPVDAGSKHMFHVARGIRLGAGDTLAVLLAVLAVLGALQWLLVVVAVLAPVAVALKVRQMFRLRPWEDGVDAGGER